MIGITVFKFFLRIFFHLCGIQRSIKKMKRFPPFWEPQSELTSLLSIRRCANVLESPLLRVCGFTRSLRSSMSMYVIRSNYSMPFWKVFWRFSRKLIRCFSQKSVRVHLLLVSLSSTALSLFSDCSSASIIISV